MKTKYSVIVLIIVFMIVCCSGCNKKEGNLKNKLSKDVYIQDRTNEYFHEQTITISSNNGYRCIDLDVDFNEEDGQYVVVIKYRQPINE